MKRRTRRPVVTYERAWSRTMLVLFDLVGADWTAPATVKVRRTQRGMTITAVFADAQGLPVTAIARIRGRGDDWTQVSEELRFSSIFQAQGAAA